MNTPAYILSSDTLSLYVDNTPITVHRSNANWEAILDCIRLGNWTAVIDLARPRIAVLRYLDGDPDFVIDGDAIRFHGEDVHPLITQRLLEHMRNNISTKPLANFARNLADNPDYWVAGQLYPFVEKGGLPLTEDGCFLAYKLVRDDYLDVHSGTVDYHIGNVVTMPRRQVDNDRNRTCSAGLHACSLEYLKSFNGDRLLAVKINPRDVVSVPADYNDTKLRCCRMEVVAELDRNLAAPAWSTPVFDYETDDDSDEDNEYYLTIYDPFRNQTLYWCYDYKRWDSEDYNIYYSREVAETDALSLARSWNTEVRVEDNMANTIYVAKPPVN